MTNLSTIEITGPSREFLERFQDFTLDFEIESGKVTTLRMVYSANNAGLNFLDLIPDGYIVKYVDSGKYPQIGSFPYKRTDQSEVYTIPVTNMRKLPEAYQGELYLDTNVCYLFCKRI